MKIDNKLLSELISYNKLRKYNFNNNIEFQKNKKLESLLCSRYNKVSRIKKHLIYMYHKKKNLYFITFTFSDKYIDKCDRTKKDLIKNSLMSFDSDLYYILNIDYGKTNEREHYHAIVGTEYDLNLGNYLDLVYPCFTKTELIRFDSNSFKKIPKYINKLSNHAIKNTTRNSRIVFNFKGYGDMTIPEVRQEYILDCWLVSLT